MAISLQELTMGRDKQFPSEYTKEIQANLKVLHEKINVIRTAYGKPMTVSSGWRPAAINSATAGAAKASKHLSGLAVDIKDTDNSLWNWCIANLQLLQDNGIYLEDRRFTQTWVHFQIGPPRSGLRIFKPSTAPMPHPTLWDGKYDKKFDKA
jgi:uncharacterized protein YcbK (DUF882 family)